MRVAGSATAPGRLESLLLEFCWVPVYDELLGGTHRGGGGDGVSRERREVSERRLKAVSRWS